MFESMTIEGENTYKFPAGYLPSYYFDAFNYMHKFENALRLFVYVTLKACLGGNWLNINLPGKDAGTISSVYKKQKSQLQSLGHIGSLPGIPLLYVSLEELTSVLDNDSLKGFIKPYFPASLEKVYIPKLCETRVLRNNLVHFRDFKKEDFDRLRFNLKDLSRPIIQILTEMCNFGEYRNPFRDDEWHLPWRPLLSRWPERPGIRISVKKHSRWIKVTVCMYTFEKEEDYSRKCNIDFVKLLDRLRCIFPYLIFFEKGIIPSNKTKDKSGRSYSFLEASEKALDIVFYDQQFINNQSEIVQPFDEIVENEDEYLEIRGDYDWDDSRNIPYLDVPEDWTYLKSYRSLDAFESPWLNREIRGNASR